MYGVANCISIFFTRNGMILHWYLKKFFPHICVFMIPMILASFGSFFKSEERLNFTRIIENKNLSASNMIHNSAKVQWLILSRMVKYYWPWQFNWECILIDSDSVFFIDLLQFFNLISSVHYSMPKCIKMFLFFDLVYLYTFLGVLHTL